MKRLLGSLLLAFLLLWIPSRALADVNDFTVTDFHGEYYLNKDSPHGSLKIKEQITVDFTDYNHGILRALPQSYKNRSLHLKIYSVTSPDGTPSSYTTYKSSGNLILQIGDPNQTVTGQHKYEIDYEVQNVVSFYSDHDEIYWDINGDQWAQPFTVVTADFYLPIGLTDGLKNRRTCYSGSYGSTTQCPLFYSMKTPNATITTA